ncbi:MAG: SpoIIE family protein phosphatase [Candidatus Riflebacteria bacterium]|nr:SpoIIE family protein phosphatase [Candidatus Riflebacteria bacterium]
MPTPHDIWKPSPDDRPGPAWQHLCAALLFGVVGTVIGSLGLATFTIGPSISAFSPASTLQIIGGMWFGLWGVASGLVIGIGSDLLSNGAGGPGSAMAHVPSHLALSVLTAWVFRRRRLDPSLPTARERYTFIAVGGLLSSVLAALLTQLALLTTHNLTDLWQTAPILLLWTVSSAGCAVLFGVPLLTFFSPLITGSPLFCKSWLGTSRPFRLSDLSGSNLTLAGQLLVAIGAAGLVPIMVLSVTGVFFHGSIGHPFRTLLPLMLNLSFFLSLVVTGAAVLSVRRRVAELTDGARRVGAGDLAHVVPEGQDELSRLVQTFNAMAMDLLGSRARLHRLMVQQEHQVKELEIAGRLLEEYLPCPTPTVPNFEFAARVLLPHRVGGDFYDFIPLPGGQLGIVVGDVCGKGVPAALFMGLSKSLIRVYSTQRFSEPEPLLALNRFLTDSNPASMFLTAFHGLLDPFTRTLTYVNAGHPPPLLVRGNGGPVEPLEGTGIVIGIQADPELSRAVVRLEVGDVLVIYSDGVTESTNTKRELFGEQRLSELVTRHASESAPRLVAIVAEEVSAFAVGQPEEDDLTVVVVRCTGAEPPVASDRDSRLHLVATRENLGQVRQFVRESATALGAAEDDVADLVLAVDEAATNVVVHGYQGAGEIDVVIAREGDRLVARLTDSASIFDPTAVPVDDPERATRELRGGGRGILLMQKTLDELVHRPGPGGGNELTLVKRLSSPAPH